MKWIGQINAKTTVNLKSKEASNKQMICTTRLFENNGMKLFVPLTYAFLVPAQAIILQIFFSKTIEDFRTEGIACLE